MFFEIPETNGRKKLTVHRVRSQNVVPRTDQNKCDVHSTSSKWLFLTHVTGSTFSDLNSLFLFMSCFQVSFPYSREKSPMAPNHGVGVSKTKTPKNTLNRSAVYRRYCFYPILVEWQTIGVLVFEIFEIFEGVGILLTAPTPLRESANLDFIFARCVWHNKEPGKTSMRYAKLTRGGPSGSAYFSGS